DFVYYEEPDFEYYTIGLIEEIKSSRRDKFAVLVKCFYRTHDIPETSKQSVLEREHYHTPSNSKLMNDVLSRELFASEVQETLTSKQLRGRCQVSHLADLRTAMDTFRPTEEDNFFYVFAYNPETRRLMNTRAEIRVGNAYQASIPPFRHYPPATYHSRPHRRSDCSKHHRSAERIAAQSMDHSAVSSSETARTETLVHYSSNGPVETASDRLNVFEDLPAARSQKLKEDSTATEPHSSNVSVKPTKPDEEFPDSVAGEEPKSPPKLKSFLSDSPKPSATPPPTSSTSTFHSGDCMPVSHRHQHHKRHHIFHRRGDSSHLRDPLRRHIAQGRSIERGSVMRRSGHRRRRRRWETMVWRPQGLSKALSGCSPDPMVNRVAQGDNELADEPLKTYLDAVRSMVAFFGFGGADDDLSSAENGLVLANLAQTTQHAYDTLHKSDYSLTQALQAISCNPIVSKVSWSLFFYYLLHCDLCLAQYYLITKIVSRVIADCSFVLLVF
ncbi:unnamed protein product, partial [Echinostoma caproni]|uniref:BAH domain-containing protein n=1 Tax=Echinostoma caproni TaxID=27848 RepID=A0A183B3X8_9TREM